MEHSGDSANHLYYNCDCSKLSPHKLLVFNLLIKKRLGAALPYLQ